MGILPRSPFLLSAFVDKLGTVLLEGGNGEESKLVVVFNLNRRPRHNHGSQGLIRLEKLLLGIGWNSNEMCLDEFGILD